MIVIVDSLIALCFTRTKRLTLVGTPRVSPLIELELHDKNQHVGRDERKPKIPDFKGFGHLVTSQVKNDQK